MKLVLKIAAGVVLAVVLLCVGCAAIVASSADDIEKEMAVHSPSLIEDADAPAEAEEYPGETAAQENARRSAEDYLGTSAFSRSGLIHQLEFEGYSDADATYGVDAVSPDWNEQAAKSAKSYLDTSSFSRSGLIHQLEFEGFTAEQAAYGVSQTGL
jgi:Host cell surface-exposed lipoprotein